MHTLRGLIGSVRGTSLLPAIANLSTQSGVVVAPARARPRAPKVGSPASTLPPVKQADELGQRTGRNTRTWRSEHRVRSNSARIVYPDPSPNLPKKARSVFSRGKGGGGQRVARARRGLRGNPLPARIQKARRHVSLLIPRPPSGLVWRRRVRIDSQLSRQPYLTVRKLCAQ